MENKDAYRNIMLECISDPVTSNFLSHYTSQYQSRYTSQYQTGTVIQNVPYTQMQKQPHVSYLYFPLSHLLLS